MSVPGLILDRDSVLDLFNIGNGAFAPLIGFLGEKDYQSVVSDMRLCDGSPWTIPVTLPVSEEMLPAVEKAQSVDLYDEGGEVIGQIAVDDIFSVDHETDLPQIFGVSDLAHPGVHKETTRSRFRIGGRISVSRYSDDFLGGHSLSPADTIKLFREKGWRTITGFQTRNPIHRAHEHLQRVALEISDGLFVQPLIGWKKRGDFTPEAVIRAYEAFIDNYFPAQRVLLGTLRTPMRYAGPREAVFHAIIRRNYGCTHFIVGRDHAGVGGFYGKYEAQKLCAEFSDLGITILPLAGPYDCERCGGVVTERTCGHGTRYEREISGTLMRQMLLQGECPPAEYMRREVAEVLIGLSRASKLLIEED